MMMERASQFEDQEKVAAFCTECGAANISACQHCQTPMEHQYVGDRHSYCAKCGKPFPWTETAIATAKEYTDEIEELSSEDKTVLKATFDDLIVYTPRTELAVTRFKRILKKVGSSAGDVLTKIFVDVSSEAIVKMLRG